jgi:hypothetical protein
LPIANDTPEPIRVILSETRVNANGKVVWTHRTAHFQQYIRSYNNAVSFTSLGAKLDCAICDTLHAQGIYTFRIHGALHHAMGSLLPPPGERPRFAQVYLYDSAQEQLDFRHETHPNLRLDILALLSAVLQDVNPLVQYWRTAGERIAGNEQLPIRLRMLDPKERDPRRYNRPTADEVAAIIVKIYVRSTVYFMTTSNWLASPVDYSTLMNNGTIHWQKQRCGRPVLSCGNYSFVFYFAVSPPVLYSYGPIMKNLYRMTVVIVYRLCTKLMIRLKNRSSFILF